MTPHRINGRGTFRIDRDWEGFGRIARASGTNDEKVYDEIVRKDGFIDTLIKLKHDGLVRDIRDGRVKAAAAYERFFAGDMSGGPRGLARGDLKVELTKWLDQLRNVETRRGYKGALKQAGLLKARIPVHELGPMLRAYRETCEQAGVWRIFNLARSAGMSFVGTKIGAQDPLYTELKLIKPLQRTKPRKLPPAHSHKELNELCDALSLRVAQCARAMAYSGMLPKEYFANPWQDLPDRIHIDGTKRGARIRDVPRLTSIAQPPCSRRTFELDLRKATKGKVSPKHFRNFFARWCDEAGVPEWRREMYMGHEIRTMSHLYPSAEIDGFLLDDSEKLRTHLGLTTKNILRLHRAS